MTRPSPSYSGTIPPAEEPGENFNIPCQRRQELLHDLENALGMSQVPVPFWACLQVCDLDQLENTVHAARHAPDFVSVFAKYSCDQIPLLWVQDPRESDDDSEEEDGDGHASSFSSSTTASTSANSNTHPAKVAYDRDDESCVFRRTGAIDIMHICPTHLIDESQPHTVKFWDLLSIFWSAEQLQLWKRSLSTSSHDDNNNTHYNNYLCISPDIHKMWQVGALAFRPLEYNTAGTELEVEWHWLPKQKHGIHDSVPLTGYLPLSSQGLYSSNDQHDRPMDVVITLDSEVLHVVRTGDKFVLRTSDPVNRPLPSKKVLDFQFVLQRVVSLAGVGREGLVSI